jgi:LPS O-antigen subunit length determinant protein (WzzB/FepE family)
MEMKPRSEEHIYDDEIDLYELWLTLKKRKITVLVSIITFVFLGALYCLFSPNIYRIDSVVSLPTGLGEKIIISFDVTKDIVDKLNDKLKERNIKYLASTLNLPSNVLSSVTLINSKKYKNDKNFIQISIESKDKKSLSQVKEAIISYLNKNPYLKIELDREVHLIKEKIEALKNKLHDQEKTGNKIKDLILHRKIRTMGFNPLDIDKTILNIKLQIKDLQILKNNIHGYKELASYLSDKPVKPKRKLIIAVSFISGLFIGIFLAFFQEWLENVRKERKA